MPQNSMPSESEETYTISQQPGITPIFSQPVTGEMPTNQIRVIDNGPAKPTGPKKGFAK